MSETKSNAPVNSRCGNHLTLKDVAEKAGVSPITVSRVVNGFEGVRSNVREKVEAAISELGYIPNRSAIDQ